VPCPLNFFEVIGLAQAKRRLLSSRVAVSFKNTFLASPRPPHGISQKKYHMLAGTLRLRRGGEGRMDMWPNAREHAHAHRRMASAVHSIVLAVAAWCVCVFFFCMSTANFYGIKIETPSIESSVHHALCFIPSSFHLPTPTHLNYRLLILHSNSSFRPCLVTEYGESRTAPFLICCCLD
jgi:hypothetical protein